MILTRPRACGAAWLLAALPLAPLAAQAPEPRPADVSTLDGIISAYYDVVSGPTGERPDRERDRTLHHPSALVGIAGVDADGRPTLRTMTLDEYHDATGEPRQQGFYEKEIHRVVERFGSVAHVWSTYASSTTPDGAPFARGINSIQLRWDGARWWILSWFFDEERPDNPIPERYLPAGLES
ncbi:MAG: hypothetical protein R3E10_13540 [Gemmatimonadota bacterium]